MHGKRKAGLIGFIRHDDDFGETLKSYPPWLQGYGRRRGAA